MKGNPLFLVVDDEEIVRESLASWLAEDGYQVEVAPDGKAAVAKLAEKPYAVLLLDLKMPGMDGLAVLTEAHRLQPDAAAIIMTAYATVDTAVAAMKQGAHDYLVKPFEPEELSALVGKLVQQQAVRARGTILTPMDLEIALPGTPSAGKPEPGDSLKEVERRHIAATLRQQNWNISRTARALEIDRVTLYNKIKRYQIREDE